MDGEPLGLRDRDGAEEAADDALLGWLAAAIPDRMGFDVGGKDGAHVVLEVNEFE